MLEGDAQIRGWQVNGLSHSDRNKLSERHMGSLGMGREQGRELALPVCWEGGTDATMSWSHPPGPAQGLMYPQGCVRGSGATEQAADSALWVDGKG